MRFLCDSNVFLAIAVEQHAHHIVASRWFAALAEEDTALFCRATRISFLRLLMEKITPDYRPLSNREAWSALVQLMDDDATGFAAEPGDLDPVWRQLAERESPSPKAWMDADLAAFAITGSLRLVTLDKDFRNHVPSGLDLLLLKA